MSASTPLRSLDGGDPAWVNDWRASEPGERCREAIRVTLVISSLAAGGAERVLSTLANCWARCGWHVTLVTLDAISTDFYPLHSDVERIGLGVSGVSYTAWQAVRSNAARVARLRRAIRASRPQVVVSFMAPTTVLTLMAARKEKVPVVVSERIDPTQYPLPRVWSVARRVAYRTASAVVVQTPEVRQWAERVVPSSRVHVIPNPVALAEAGAANTSAAAPPLDRTARHVVAMGRLDAQKGFDILVRAFADCYATRPEWRLTVLGDGKERHRLATLAEELGVATVVAFPGRVTAPAAVLRSADLFVLSSRYEGFPNALLEAMAVGLPVVATDCPSGPKHIVRDGIDGILVPVENAAALATSMAVLMDDETLRRRFGERAADVTERFGVGRIMAEWESLLRRVMRTDTQARARGQA